MAKSKHVSSRGLIFIFAAVIAAVVIGVTATAHADQKGQHDKRGDRGDRGERGLKVLISQNANINAQATNVRIVHDKVIVKGAQVTATSTGGFSATTGTPQTTFNVQTDSSTKFEFKGLGKGTIASLAVGDTVNFRGLILSGTTTSTLTINATNVEGKTKHPNPPKPPHLTIAGTVASVSVTGNTLVIVEKSGTTTVSVSGDTKIMGDATSLVGVTVASHVRATGVLNSGTNVFAAARLHVDTDDEAGLDLTNVIARLAALIEKLKLRFGL